MYVLSQSLNNEIRAAVARVKSALPELEFDEYIAIPAFGSNIILRFEYAGKEPLTLPDLDALECRLRELVGENFMANLMGDASRQCGLDFSRLNEILVRIDANESASIRTCPAHIDGLTADCTAICEHFGLSSDVPIWEIQVNPEGLLVLALHPMNEHPPFADRESSLDGQSVRIHFLPDDGSYRGLMKAASRAAEENVSITHVLLDFS